MKEQRTTNFEKNILNKIEEKSIKLLNSFILQLQSISLILQFYWISWNF